MYITSSDCPNLLSVHTVPVSAYSLFLSITDVRSAVSGSWVIEIIKHDKEKYFILIQASFAILSCLSYPIIFRQSHLKASTTYRISSFGSCKTL